MQLEVGQNGVNILHAQKHVAQGERQELVFVMKGYALVIQNKHRSVGSMNASKVKTPHT